MLEFNHEEVQDFIDELDDIISEIEEDIEGTEQLKNEVQGIASGSAINAYGEYGVELADYENSLEFYIAIRDDLQEFLNEIDSNVKFTRSPDFKYDEQLINEINNLIKKTNKLRANIFINTSTGSRDYTPYPSSFQRGNFFHKGSPEEQLIDSNDGIIKSWAQEINSYFGKLRDNQDELERLYKIYFEDITLDDWKKEHDKYDGIAEHSAEWHKASYVVAGALSFATGAYAYSSSRRISNKSINKLPSNVQDSYGNYSNYSTKKGSSSWNNNARPKGAIAGKSYNNFNKKLPKGNYKEYDVNPKTGKTRDSERFIRNEDTGDVYYTKDHYDTFVKIEE